MELRAINKPITVPNWRRGRYFNNPCTGTRTPSMQTMTEVSLEKRAFISTVRSTVHTIKSDMKTELFENALQTGGI